MPQIRSSRQEATFLGWLKALPDELIYYRPVLSVWYAHVLLSGGEIDSVEGRLQDAERWLRTPADVRARPDAPEGAMVVLDEEEFRRLPGAIAIARAGLALVLGDVAGTLKYARQVLDLVPEDDYFGRGSSSALLGLAYWASGDLEAAHRLYGDGMAFLQKAGRISNAIGGALALADIRVEQGRLREAMSTYERGLQLAMEQTERGALVLPEAGDMYVGMSEIEREQGDPEAAAQHLLKSKEQGEPTGFPQYPYRRNVALARIRETEGDLEGALELLQEAERVYVSDFFPNVRPVAAMKARVSIMQGKLGEALTWARERGLSAEEDLSYLREFEHITFARLLLAQYKREGADGYLRGALGLLERLLKAAEEGGRTRSVLEILVLQSLARQMQGDMAAALAPLERALTLAEPEGYVRLFVDEGMPMAELLREAAKQGITPNYVHRLLAAFGETGEAEKAEGRTSSTQSLIEPLSERELEVLRLLRTELSGPEVAHELMVSLSTMRTHTRNIYNKLGVDNRRAAVRRAEELHLL
jgi:LuxR family maltose regulon positive regulatory protein